MAAEGLLKNQTRPPIASGSFYPEDTKELRETVLRYLDNEHPISNPKILIVPHAGYEFSGNIAGEAYSTVPSSIHRVIIIAPSHDTNSLDWAVTDCIAYKTPLGEVPCSKDLPEDSKKIEDKQHSIEVQLPFLQVKLENFEIIPILTGKADPHKLADVIEPLMDARTLVVVSTDLSHYNTLEVAKKRDKRTTETITSLNPEGFIDACGEVGIRTALLLAQRKNLTARPVTYGNSSKDFSENKVVGYASIAFTEPTSKKSSLDEDVKDQLLQIAMESVKAAVKGTKPSIGTIPKIGTQPYGVFVTLNKNGALRGCMGDLKGQTPLYKGIMENARNAALNDTRFDPVKIDELSSLEIEISILSKPEDVQYSSVQDLFNQIEEGKDGVILSKKGKSSTYLPQVWEDIPDKRQFFEELSRKAGLEKDAWKTATIQKYRVVKFSKSIS